MNNFTNIPELIFKLGGTGSVSKLLKTNPSTISNWKKKNKIPKSYLRLIHILLKERNLDIYKENIDNNIINSKQKKSKFSILVIISGGVSCYKVLDLIRLYHKNNYDIEVILTKSAQKFISPLLVTSLINKKCFTELFSSDENENMNHINLARNKDLILVAPCTANFMAKISHGIADDLGSNVILASESKILIAPSMNPYMWENKATQDNLKILKQRGINLINPESGMMACGENGTGRLPEIDKIYSFTRTYLLEKEKMSNIKFKSQLKILITAGPTQEKIDPIRYVSNNSSGKQGYALAEEFLKLGANVTLISGPTNINKPNVNKYVEVSSAKEMLSQVENNIDCDIFISCAAVCDWKLIPYTAENKKLSNNDKLKKKNNIIFKLESNPDIIKFVSKNKKRPKLVIGFAAETKNLIHNARKKLQEKQLDMIIANLIEDENSIFGKEFNKIFIIDKYYNIQETEKLKKHEIANLIISKSLKLYQEMNAENYNRKSITV
ncbi:bifunctional phosphopantothenoylcysteine decarboxylase/phosphopantothenate--cysteine ligase CoaBC [Alphaproteobacteria bacterium]|nr:bifunctional phosphopantothenoylcysteine decarboxylase/phosphopantothenate--cysteine ligase CoaBC [Alphaproteobacteria bacterium]